MLWGQDGSVVEVGYNSIRGKSHTKSRKSSATDYLLQIRDKDEVGSLLKGLRWILVMRGISTVSMEPCGASGGEEFCGA